MLQKEARGPKEAKDGRGQEGPAWIGESSHGSPDGMGGLQRAEGCCMAAKCRSCERRRKTVEPFILKHTPKKFRKNEVLVSLVVMIRLSHSRGRGSIPRRGNGSLFLPIGSRISLARPLSLRLCHPVLLRCCAVLLGSTSIACFFCLWLLLPTCSCVYSYPQGPGLTLPQMSAESRRFVRLGCTFLDKRAVQCTALGTQMRLSIGTHLFASLADLST